MSDEAPWSSLVSKLFSGRARAGSGDEDLGLHLSTREGPALAAKLRQAYYWIVNNAIIAPYYDIEFGENNASKFAFPNGDVVKLPTEASYCSYVLLPLLTFATRRRALLVGGPGKGKTATAILMGILAGYTYEDVRRSVQHGHPQLTIADLLGTPLPSAMMEAKALEEVQVSWRRWLTMRVKIVDEYNRIPTKTQSALLSLMAEDTPRCSIKSSRPKTQPGSSPPTTTSAAARSRSSRRSRTASISRSRRCRSTLDSSGNCSRGSSRGSTPTRWSRPTSSSPPRSSNGCGPRSARCRSRLRSSAGSSSSSASSSSVNEASVHFEYKNKDTLRLAGIPLAQVCNEQCPLDKTKHLCAQTQQGLSVRSFQTILDLAKSMAYIRTAGAGAEVTIQDLRQVIPFALHEKITPNAAGDFFQVEANRTFLSDKIAWIRRMFDMALASYDQLDRDRQDPARELAEELDRGLEGVAAKTIEERMKQVQALIVKATKQGELAPYVYEDLIRLKSIYMRYQNQLLWLRGQG